MNNKPTKRLLQIPNNSIITMPNFNTKDMKIAIAKEKGGIEGMAQAGAMRLPERSIDMLKKALAYSTTYAYNVTVVVAYLGFFIDDDDFRSIKDFLEVEMQAEVVLSLEDFIAIRAKSGHYISVKLCGSSGRFLPAKDAREERLSKKRPPFGSEEGPSKKRPRIGLEKSSESVHSPEVEGALTQECNGVFRALEELDEVETMK